MPAAVPIPAEQIPANPPDLSDKLPRLTPRRRPQTQQQPSNPPPPTPPLPPAPSRDSLSFTRPTRRILSRKDHELFLASPTHDLVTSFVFTLSESVRDTSVSAVKSRPQDPIISTLLTILDDAEAVIAKCPPEDTGGSRFGNKAFRDYIDAIEGSWEGLEDPAAVQEISTYLHHSFGNRTRIDYGSGHELNFAIWLLCLNRVSLLPEATFPHLALVVFPRYLRVMRAVQATYYLEPAGSHGLSHHPHIRPLSIHQTLVLEECGRDYLYLDQVAFVNSVKNVEGLRWHSPMLDDISAAKNWQKVEAGMRRMFLAEVLGKLPVMQHFLFASLVPAVEGMSTEDEAEVEDEMDEPEGGEGVVEGEGMKHVHAHDGTGWGDCCGIKVPSSVGAMQEMKKRTGGEGLRRIPFD
ncbi:Serine/threonine-protein phosphatase 2A activator 2 [Taxawa tesnikishii (nom. ined.)]|nr:Serine/threonine-protein phosphatase 2A activator 2 [Dothideales sp. JES 119]